MMTTMSLLDGIGLVSFDVWNTLVKANKAYAPKRARVIADALGWQGDIDVLAEAVRKASKEMDDQMEITGTCLNFVPRIDYACDLLGQQRLSEYGLAELEGAVMESHRDFPPSLTEPGLLHTLSMVKDLGLKTAVMSNTGITSGPTLRMLLDEVGILPYIDFELYSDEVGSAKPSRHIFGRLAQISGIPSTHTMHIGDNRNADYDGARASKLHARWYTKETHSGVLTIASHAQLLN